MMDKKNVTKYWLGSSDIDYNAMEHLFEKGDYPWSLFIGHLVLEKLLKAYYVQKVAEAAPFIHDLVRLSDKAGLVLTEDQKDVLDTISTFNISARYDDYKMAFHKKCDHKFTEKWINEIRGMRKWIKDQFHKK